MTTTLTQHEIDQNTVLLMAGSKIGDIDEVKRLIPFSDPKAQHSYALQEAATNGYLEIVKLLLPVSDPATCQSYALKMAAFMGHTEIVELLIPVSDPTLQNSAVLKQAVDDEYIDIVKLLIPVSDYKLVLEEINQNGEYYNFQLCIDEYKTLQQKERLTANINTIGQTKTNPIKRKM